MDSPFFDSPDLPVCKGRGAETQDNLRERQVIAACGLRRVMSRILHDAEDDVKNRFEIKTVTVRKGVSTARQVHLRKVQRWRERYWIVAYGPRTDDGMDIREMYLLHPDDLEPFFSSCEAKINSKMEKCRKVIEIASLVDPDLVDEVVSIMEVGSRLDDPTIPMSLIRTAGVVLDVDDPTAAAATIAEFVTHRPVLPPVVLIRTPDTTLPDVIATIG